MRATLTLNLINNESSHLFTRKLKNGDAFMVRIAIKIGLLIKESLLNNAYALTTLYTLHDEMLHLGAYFDDEMDRFEGQLEKKKMVSAQKIHFTTNYEHAFPCSNAFAMGLAELIEGFDKLMSTLKLMYLSGLFESREAYYSVKQTYQKQLNTYLGKVSQTASYKHKTLSVQEAIQTAKTDNELTLLKNALNSPYAPGFSPHSLSQLNYQINAALASGTHNGSTELKACSA